VVFGVSIIRSRHACMLKHDLVVAWTIRSRSKTAPRCAFSAIVRL